MTLIVVVVVSVINAIVFNFSTQFFSETEIMMRPDINAVMFLDTHAVLFSDVDAVVVLVIDAVAFSDEDQSLGNVLAAPGRKPTSWTPAWCSEAGLSRVPSPDAHNLTDLTNCVKVYLCTCNSLSSHYS